MSQPTEKLHHAYKTEQLVTVTLTGGETHENCGVKDVTHVQTDHFDILEFVLGTPFGEVKVFGTDLKSVEIND